jgi:hypothetical protein
MGIGLIWFRRGESGGMCEQRVVFREFVCSRSEFILLFLVRQKNTMNVLSQTTNQVPVWQGCFGLKSGSGSRLFWLIFFVFSSVPNVGC